MSFIVEPRDGRELERLVTATLNLTGLAKRLIDEAVAGGATGVGVIDIVAEQMACVLAPVAEHASDDDLHAATAVVGHSALVLANALGLADLFS